MFYMIQQQQQQQQQQHKCLSESLDPTCPKQIPESTISNEPKVYRRNFYQQPTLVYFSQHISIFIFYFYCTRKTESIDFIAWSSCVMYVFSIKKN
jgi:hypothetical protein